MRSLLYLDSSGLIKLIVPERETQALLTLLDDWPERISSMLAKVEVLRAVRRAVQASGRPSAGGKPEFSQITEMLVRRAEAVLVRLGLVAMDRSILDVAARVEPSRLRSLDAIHLATALSIEDLGALVTYGPRLAEAAASLGVTTLTPR